MRIVCWTPLESAGSCGDLSHPHTFYCQWLPSLAIAFDRLGSRCPIIPYPLNLVVFRICCLMDYTGSLSTLSLKLLKLHTAVLKKLSVSGCLKFRTCALIGGVVVTTSDIKHWHCIVVSRIGLWTIYFADLPSAFSCIVLS